MTRLVETLHELGLDGEIELGGRWVTLRGAWCRAYVVEAPWGGSYYTWCDRQGARAIEPYADPADAIRAGLRRASVRVVGDEAGEGD